MQRFTKKNMICTAAVAAALAAMFVAPATASSHREAPFITTSPKVDGTDFYMFRSYEGIAANGTGGRSDYVTLLANYHRSERGGDRCGANHIFFSEPWHECLLTRVIDVR